MADTKQASFYQEHKTAIWIGGGIALVGVAYLIYKHMHSSSSNSTTSTTSATTGSQVVPIYTGYAPTSGSVGAAAGTTNAQIYTQLLAKYLSKGGGVSTANTALETHINTQASTQVKRVSLSTPKITRVTTQMTYGRPPDIQPGGVIRPVTTKISYQKAPTYNSFRTGSATYTPVTVFKVSSGNVYFKTASTGRSITMPVATAKKIEHTGTRKYPQYTTYEKVA